MNKAAEVDIYRDTPIRYLGYANEVGEAFRSLVRKSVVHSSYVVAFSYVLADAISKARKPKPASADTTDTVHRIIVFSDALLWQSFASVIIPGITINRLCATCAYTLERALKSSPLTTRKWMCTAFGLMAIPFIIHPIDRGVDFAMDNTIRKMYVRIDANGSPLKMADIQESKTFASTARNDEDE